MFKKMCCARFLICVLPVFFKKRVSKKTFYFLLIIKIELHDFAHSTLRLKIHCLFTFASRYMIVHRLGDAFDKFQYI